MAANSKAIGLLFEVAGGGNINGETGKRINGQLRNLVGAINKSDTLKLKFTIDSNHFKKEIDLIKKQLQSINATSGNGGGGGASGGVSKHSEAWRNATAAMTEYYKLQTQVQQAMTRTNDIVANGDGTFSTHNQRWAELITQTNQAKAAFDTYNETSARANMTLEERVNIDNRINDAEARLAINMKTFEATGQQAWNNLTAKVHDYIGRVEESANRDEQAKQKLQELREMANGTDWRGYDALKDKLGEVQTYINQNSLATETWYQKMLKTFGTRVRSLLAGLILAKVTTALRDIYNNVVEIDTAMTELKIVTQENDKALERYAKTAEKAAQRIGASVSDLIKSTTTYARLGFSLDEAGLLGELTTAYSKVGDVSVDEATKNITGIVKAYKVNAEDLEFVIDKLIYVGRKFAISSGEIGEGMNNAASSLAANGNTLNQAMGILTAANTTVQDISRASTATRTIAARLSASKQELEELGETVEADTVIKLKNAFKAYGIEITDGNDKLKSTYDILGSIAEKWDELNEEERSAITTLAAGTRQQDIFYSIIANWNDAQRVVAEADGATGELADATAQRLDSIQGKLDQLKAKFETLSASILDSDIVKFLVDVVNFILDIVNGLVAVVNWFGGVKAALIAIATTLAIIKSEVILINAEVLLTNIIALLGKMVAPLVHIYRYFALSKAFGVSFGKALSSGLANVARNAKTAFTTIVTGANASKIAMGALAAAIGVTILVINKIQQAREEAVQEFLSDSSKVQQEAEQLQSDAEESAKSLAELVDEYKKLYESKDGVWDGEALVKVQSIQNSIVKLIGDQAAAIDIVNGKLDDQLTTLKEITKENYKQAYDQAVVSVTDAEEAIKKANSGIIVKHTYEVDKNGAYRDWFREEAAKYGIEVGGKTYSSMGISTTVPTIKQGFDNAEDFVKQYEAVQRFKTDLAIQGKGGEDAYKEASLYLSDFKDVYERYKSAKDYLDTLTAHIEETINSIGEDDSGKPLTVNYKPIAKILEEVQDGFDGISDALNETSDAGYLSADTLSKLAKLEEDNALAGLKLSDIIEHDGKGYKIASNALEQYVDALIEAEMAQYANAKAFASEEDKQNAIDNYTNLLNLIKLVTDSQLQSADATKAQKKEWEDQKDALKDQLDAYKKLIDLRKELLKQYEDELTYKKELAEKERRVSQLQTQLAVSQLDTSAAGRAKSRQLSKDLKEAQEELDDFTLEHAIDVVTNELDTQYAEHENYINGQIDGIEDKIDDLGSSTSSSISGAANSVATAAASAADKITEAIKAIEVAPVVNVAGTSIVSGAASGAVAASGGSSGSKTRWTSYEDAGAAGFANIRTRNEFARGNNSDKQKYGTYQAYLDAMYEKYMGKTPVYHAGGIVGEMTRLKSTETFAKLLKGEFVATPQMMSRFMTSTLPTIASNGGNTEINAPLISIQCDNVTQESLPRLEEIVNEAVKTIKKQFDDGLGRAGYHKTVKQMV